MAARLSKTLQAEEEARIAEEEARIAEEDDDSYAFGIQVVAMSAMIRVVSGDRSEGCEAKHRLLQSREGM